MWISSLEIGTVEIGQFQMFSNFLSIPIKRLDKINDEFDSFQYFWQDRDIFEGQLINENVLERFHHDHDQYARRPLKLTSQGSAKWRQFEMLVTSRVTEKSSISLGLPSVR